MVLFKEVWMGDVDHGTSPPLHKVNFAEARRAAAEEHSGTFQCLTLTTAIVPPEDSEAPPQSNDSSLLTATSEDEYECEGDRESSLNGTEDQHAAADSNSSTYNERRSEEGFSNKEQEDAGSSAGSEGSGHDVAGEKRTRGKRNSAADTLDDGVVKAHFSTEVQQHWEPPEQEYGEYGVTWWLPHGASVCFLCCLCCISVCCGVVQCGAVWYRTHACYLTPDRHSMALSATQRVRFFQFRSGFH
jgi:hypothetical protein